MKHDAKSGKTTGAGPTGKAYAQESAKGSLNYQPTTSPTNGVPGKYKPAVKKSS